MKRFRVTGIGLKMETEKVLEYWQVGVYGSDHTSGIEYEDEFKAINCSVLMLQILLKSAHSCPVQLAVWQNIGQMSRIVYIVNKNGVFAYQRSTVSSPG